MRNRVDPYDLGGIPLIITSSIPKRVKNVDYEAVQFANNVLADLILKLRRTPISEQEYVYRAEIARIVVEICASLKISPNQKIKAKNELQDIFAKAAATNARQQLIIEAHPIRFTQDSNLVFLLSGIDTDFNFALEQYLQSLEKPISEG